MGGGKIDTAQANVFFSTLAQLSGTLSIIFFTIWTYFYDKEKYVVGYKLTITKRMKKWLLMLFFIQLIICVTSLISILFQQSIGDYSEMIGKILLFASFAVIISILLLATYNLEESNSIDSLASAQNNYVLSMVESVEGQLEEIRKKMK